jgi:TolB-like protein
MKSEKGKMKNEKEQRTESREQVAESREQSRNNCGMDAAVIKQSRRDWWSFCVAKTPRLKISRTLIFNPLPLLTAHCSLLTFLLITALVFAACASSSVGSVADELDLAIRDASDYLNDNIPAGSKIVILNIESNSTALSEYIIDELIANAVNDRLFEVVDRQQLDLIREEQNFQWAGEVDDNLALEVGRFFGAQIIVSGRVSQIADRYRFTVRALEVQTARVVGQNNFNIAAGATISALIRSQATASGSRTQTTSSGQTAQTTPQATVSSGTTPTAQPTAQPARLQNGTYIFYPRVRCYRKGIPGNHYLDRIVVSGEYMIIYVCNAERGRGNPNNNSGRFVWGSSESSVLLSDLDNPRRTWALANAGEDEITNGQAMSFRGVTGSRFNLINTWYGDEFVEINLADAEYEP